MTELEKLEIYNKARAEYRALVERDPKSFLYTGLDDPRLEADACEHATWKLNYHLNPPDPASAGPIEIGGNGHGPPESPWKDSV
jgi:hypothetical protein